MHITNILDWTRRTRTPSMPWKADSKQGSCSKDNALSMNIAHPPPLWVFLSHRQTEKIGIEMRSSSTALLCHVSVTQMMLGFEIFAIARSSSILGKSDCALRREIFGPQFSRVKNFTENSGWNRK